MTTKLQCVCGAELTPAVQDAGQMINCQLCGASVRVPSQQLPLKLQKNKFSDEELSAPFTPIRDDDESSSTSRLPLITGVAGFASGVALTLLVVFMMGPTTEPQSAARRPATNPSPAPAAITPTPAVAPNSSPPMPVAAAVPATTLPPTAAAKTEPVVVAEAPLKEPAADVKIPKELSKPVLPVVAAVPDDPDQPIALQFPARGKFQHSFKIEQTDAAPEYSMFMLQTSGEEFDPKLNVFFLSNKVIGKSTETINFAFATAADSWEYLELNEITFIVDGEPLEVGESLHSGKTLKSGGVVELITVAVELEDFLKILEATKVEVSLGGTEFPLTEEQLEALRDLATRIPDGETTPGNYLISHAPQ